MAAATAKRNLRFRDAVSIIRPECEGDGLFMLFRRNPDGTKCNEVAYLDDREKALDFFEKDQAVPLNGTDATMLDDIIFWGGTLLRIISDDEAHRMTISATPSQDCLDLMEAINFKQQYDPVMEPVTTIKYKDGTSRVIPPGESYPYDPFKGVQFRYQLASQEDAIATWLFHGPFKAQISTTKESNSMIFDERLRQAGFTIASRPKHGPPTWTHCAGKGKVFSQAEAVAILDGKTKEAALLLHEAEMRK